MRGHSRRGESSRDEVDSTRGDSSRDEVWKQSEEVHPAMKETLGCFCESRSKVVLDEVKKLGDGNDVGHKRVETDGPT